MTKLNTIRIDSARLKSWDYSTPWWYYVTINTKRHKEYFGEIEFDKIKLNVLGEVADLFWKEIPTHFKNVELDSYIIMPNHIHGIIIINDCSRDVACNVSTKKENIFSNISPKANSLSAIIRSFKSAVSKQIHEIGYPNFSWQSRFYDRIILNEKELLNIRKYIEQNPLRWELDKNKPENICDF